MRPRQSKALNISIILFAGVLATAFVIGQKQLVLYNPSESLAPGLYRLTYDDPAVGRVISFPLPARIQPYIRERMGSMDPDWLILKPVVAAGGDHVCVSDAGLTINEERVADVTTTDYDGNSIPVWEECRELTNSEYFVFSDRIERSLDSRYVGPIHAKDIAGVYTTLWTWK